jgi:hypothetical protein
LFVLKLYILYNPKSTATKSNSNTLPSIGKPGGGGIPGGGGPLGPAKAETVRKTKTPKMLFGGILMDVKVIKKSFCQNFFFN